MGTPSPGNWPDNVLQTRCRLTTSRHRFERAAVPAPRAFTSPNQVLTHAARAAAKQLNKHLFLATNMCVRARATARGGATEFMHLRRDRFRTFRRPSRGRLGIRDIRGIELVQ